MVSIFKTSCFVFWLIWMSTLSFLFGIKYIQDRYSYLDIEQSSGTLMTAACIATITMAVLGCCCVKFDVMHVCCAAWYIGLTFFGIVIACVWVMHTLKSSPSETLVNEVDLLQKVIQSYKSHKKIPYFLHHTQMKLSCCGIVGFKDYRAFILSNSVKQDVPYSCCKQPIANSNGDPYSCNTTGTGARTDLTELYIKYEPNQDKLPKNYKAGVALLKQYYGEDYLDNPDHYKNESLRLPVHKTKAKSVFLMGCYQRLKTNSQELHDTYFKFCLVLMASSVLMVILYIRNCLKARRIRRDRMKEMIVGSGSLQEAPKVSAVSGDFSEEEQQQMLHDLTYLKKNKLSADYTGQARPDFTKLASAGAAGNSGPPNANLPGIAATKIRR